MTETQRHQCAQRPRRLLPTALAVAGIVVLSGTTGAVAAGQITGAQIQNGSVTGTDIKDGTLTSGDVARYTLRPADTSAALGPLRAAGRRLRGEAEARRSFASGATGSVATLDCPAGTAGARHGRASGPSQHVGPQVVIQPNGRFVTAYQAGAALPARKLVDEPHRSSR